MERRAFIRKTIQTALCAGVLPVLELLPAQAKAPSSVMAVRQGLPPEQLVQQTLEALGGIEHFIRPGDTVVIKPNIGWDRRPEQAANTHPLVVKALVEHCLDARAKKIRIFDHSCNDARRCYRQSGIHDALASIKDPRVDLEYIQQWGWRKVAIKDGQEITSWEFYRPALEADRYINVPVAKHHGLSTLTLAMKNTMGVIGGNRGRLHRHIGPALADINSVVVSDLTVIDATRILVANGPQGGNLSDVREKKTIIASNDIVAADAHAATLFGYKPTEIETIVAGAKRSLGTLDLTQVTYR